jgi:hypothetical protein
MVLLQGEVAILPGTRAFVPRQPLNHRAQGRKVKTRTPAVPKVRTQIGFFRNAMKIP